MFNFWYKVCCYYMFFLMMGFLLGVGEVDVYGIDSFVGKYVFNYLFGVVVNYLCVLDFVLC